MSREPVVCDCAIVGAGPAGSALAGLLARRGFAVLLLDDARSHAGAPLETLLPSALAALQRCGLAEVVRAAAQPDRRRHGARWDDDVWRWRDGDGVGLALRRPWFDAALRRWAIGGGVTMLEPARVAAAALAAFAAAGELHVECAGGSRRIAPRVLVVATGRRGALVPGCIEHLGGPASAAFAFANVDGAARDDQALVTAEADGWCWWIGDGERGSTVVAAVDADELQRHGRRALLDRLLRAAGEPFSAFVGTQPVGAVAATPRWRRPPAGLLLLGDAAATLDPLASQGTEKALVGAEHAAVAIAAALRGSAPFAACFDLHTRWERDLFFAHCQQTAAFHSRPQRFLAEPFWQRRAVVASSLPAQLPLRLQPAATAMATTLHERLGDDVVAVDAIALHGGEPIARVGRVLAAPVLHAFAGGVDVATGIARAGADARLFALGSAAVRAAVVELYRLGLLMPAPPAASAAR